MELWEEVVVGSSGDVRARDGVLVRLPDEREVGVFRLPDGRLVAYENRCSHQGGPVCSGVVLGRYEQVLRPDMTVEKERFVDGDPHLVCPWHGWEFSLASGECAANGTFRLRSFPVSERDDTVYLGIPRD